MGKPIKNIVMFSGGKDSTAQLFLMLENNIRVDEIVMCDLGYEYPEMYEHIKKVENLSGIKIKILKPEKPFIYWFAIHFRRKGKRPNEFYYDELGNKKPVKKDGKHSSDIFVDTNTGYGWADMGNRWCTSIKLHTINNYLKDQREKYNITEWHGIAIDEPLRLEKNKGRNIRYILAEKGMTEKEALNYCYKLGFTWGGLYKKLGRVSCYCCPLQNKKELTYLYSERPELWEEMRFLDSQSWRKFSPNRSLKQIEEWVKAELQQLKLEF